MACGCLCEIKEVVVWVKQRSSIGVDTLVLNAFYTDERGQPIKRELDPALWVQLDEWKRASQEAHEE